MKIEVKNPSVLEVLLSHEHSPVLIEIVFWLANNHGLVITEGFREQTHPNDLHGLEPVRAIDVRSSIYDLPQKIEEEINKRWVYDPDRPHMRVAILHDSGSGLHIHIQIHPKTERCC